MNLQGGPTTSSQPGSPTGPVFERGRSPLLRPFLFLAGVVAVGLIAFLGYRMASDDSGGSQPEDPSSVGAIPAIRLDPVEPESIDELQPALDAVAAQHDEPLALYRLEMSAEEIVAVIQVPGEPELLDRYTWSNGGLSRPSPVDLSEAQLDALPGRLFSAEEVDPDVVAAILADSATQHPDDPNTDIVTTDIDVYTGLGPADPDVILVVNGRDYASEDGNMWSLTYGPDGTFLRKS